MAFRIFRFLVTAIAGLVTAWLIVFGGVLKIIALASTTTFSPGAVIRPVLFIVAGLVVAAGCWYSVWSRSGLRKNLESICAIPELLRKLLFTGALLCIYRIGFHVPLAGIDQAKLQQLMGQEHGAFSQAIQYFGMFTGGSLKQSTLFGLGIMPYITAAIIFQLLGTVVPALEKLQKEGAAGYKKIQEYTRYATVVLCIFQAIVWMRIMLGAGGMNLVYPEYQNSYLVFLMGVVGLTAGTVFLMWLGEQIDEYGIGNGISLIIMAGIVARLPGAIKDLVEHANPSLSAIGSTTDIGPEKILFLIAAFIFVVAGVILITQGQRRIPTQHAKHTRGRRVYGGERQYLPLRVNHGGVMPIIFASSLLIFPNAIFRWLDTVPSLHGRITNSLAGAFSRGSYIYSVIYIAMIFFFAYFWTTVQFRPKEMAEQLRDSGAFIPGLRPGRRTAEYLERVMERITYCGAGFLSVIAVFPMFVAAQLNIPWMIASFLGGTGLLICVAVALDLVQRIEAQLVMRNYGGFLGGSARIKGGWM